jgi:RNA polymerase sigma-54 factor
MRIGPSLILATRQTLAMTPQLQQAIKLLQFSHLELAAFIQQELEKNPLLAEGTADDGPIAEQEAPVLDAPTDTAEALAAAAPALAEADERWTREHADRGGDATASKVGPRDDLPDALDFVAQRPRSLATHVLEQIELMFSDATDRRIALKLAEGLDEAGYCRLDAPAIAEAVSVGLEMVEAVWARLRQIEPAGLFARTVAECLGAQLAERDRLDPAMKALLDNLDLVAAGEPGQLRRRCGVDDEDLRDMLAELRTSIRAPARRSTSEPIQPVAPDLYLTPPRMPTPARKAGISSSIPTRCPRCWSTATTTPR